MEKIHTVGVQKKALAASPNDYIGPCIHKNQIYVLLPIKTCSLGTQSCHISVADDPIGVKFGFLLVLMIILVPFIHKKTARVARTTLNV